MGWVVAVVLLVLAGAACVFRAVCKRRPVFGLAGVLLGLTALGIAVFYVSRPAETKPVDPNPAASFRIVALGDSYISGEGAERYFPGTDKRGNRCHRAATAHPYLVAEKLGAALTFIACSGAETPDVLTAGQFPKTDDEGVFGRRPQIEELKGVAEPDAVLISIGGNDAGFAEIGLGCASPGEPDCRRSASYWLRQLDDRVYPAVERTYAAVRAAVPGAEVFAVTYPNPLARPYCNDIRLSGPEMEFVSEVFVARLNQLLEYAARRARVRVLDMTHALDGHRICEVRLKKAAVNFIKLGRTSGSTLELNLETLASLAHGTFHPNVLGHELMVRRVLATMKALQSGSLGPLPEPPPDARPPAFDAEELQPPVGPNSFPAQTPCTASGRTLAFVSPTTVDRDVREVSLADLTPASTVCYRSYRASWKSKRADRDGVVRVPVDVQRAGVASINEILAEQAGGVWKKVVVSRIGAADEGQEPEERSNLLAYLVLAGLVAATIVAALLWFVGCRMPRLH